MERIDKIISSQGKYSRSEIKNLASQGRIKINDNIVKKVNEKKRQPIILTSHPFSSYFINPKLQTLS